jgi:20S proteasome alpha/beta subunit
MSLCIATPAKLPGTGTPCVVLCFDSKVSCDEFGSETEHKFYVLSDSLMALVAGKTSRGRRLALAYRRLLALNSAPSDGELLAMLDSGAATVKAQMAEAYIQRRLAISYADLLAHGEQWLGKDLTQKHLAAIDSSEIGADMIVAGFLAGVPVICQISKGGSEIVTNHAIIGTGSYTAEPSLHARGHTTNTWLPEAIYNTYEAKKIGESSPYVGAETRMYILQPPQAGQTKLSVLVLMEPGEKLLKKRFKTYGPRPIPISLKSKPFPDEAFMVGRY